MYKLKVALIMLSLIWTATIAQSSTIMLAPADSNRPSVMPETLWAQEQGIGVGDTFRDSVYMTNGRHVFMWVLWMTFNPKVLNCVRLREGPFIRQFYNSFFTWADIDNNNGILDMVTCTSVQLEVDSNTATLCYIDWQVMDTGSSILGLDSVFIINAEGIIDTCATDSGYFYLPGGPGVVEEAQPPNQSGYLLQAYPNPFREKTVISYQIPSKTDISLKVYDLCSRVIRTIVNRVVSPGSYTVEWDRIDDCGKKVVSGIYFYRLEAGDFVATKKLTVLQ